MIDLVYRKPGAGMSFPVPIKPEVRPDAAVEAIKFALQADEGIEFLRVWMYGDFDVIRREWPDCQETVFVGADPAVST